MSRVPSKSMTKQFKFKVVRRVQYLPNTGAERVVLQLKARTPIATVELELPASDFRSNRALDAVTDQTGYIFADFERARAKLFAAAQKPCKQIAKTSVAGWHPSPGGAFVTPGDVFGEEQAARKYEYLADPMAGVVGAGCAGTASMWRQTVGQGMRKSSCGMTLVGAAIAAPLIPFTELRELFTFVLAGDTSTGKSTIQDGAISIQGRPTEISPDSTLRALQERGAAFNHMLFPVGDLSLLSPQARWTLVSHRAYGVTATASRATSRVNARTLPTLTFQNIVVCTSEASSTQIAEAAGAERQGGESVRLFDLTCSPVPGFFDLLGEGDDPAEVAEEILRAAKTSYGVILREWIAWICDQDQQWLASRLEIHICRFVAAAAKNGRRKERERRAARKFGLIYGALILAIKAQVLDWTRAEARRAVMRSYELAMANAPTETAAEAVADLLRLLSAPGMIVEEDCAEDDPNWLGVRTRAGIERVVGLRHAEIIGALGPYKAKLAIRSLRESGFLKVGRGQERWQKRIGRTRFRLLQLDPRALAT